MFQGYFIDIFYEGSYNPEVLLKLRWLLKSYGYVLLLIKEVDLSYSIASLQIQGFQLRVRLTPLHVLNKAYLPLNQNRLRTYLIKELSILKIRDISCGVVRKVSNYMFTYECNNDLVFFNR